MAIRIRCETCSSRFNAPDHYGGREVKCPQCRGLIRVPMPSAEPAQTPPVTSVVERSDSLEGTERPPDPEPVGETPEQWYMRADDEEYGPVSREELEQWVVEGRLDAECQVLREGWDQWQWADAVFPDLGPPAPPPVVETKPATLEAPIFFDPAPPSQDEASFDLSVIEEDPVDLGGISDSDDVDAPNLGKASAVARERQAAPVAPAQETVSPTLLRTLGDTRPWIVLMAILGLVTGGLGLLGGLVMTVLAALSGQVVGVVMSLGILVGPTASLLAAYYLYSYGSRLADFLRSHQPNDLEAAMRAQRQFWKLLGMMVAVVLGLYLLLLVIALAGGLLAAA